MCGHGSVLLGISPQSSRIVSSSQDTQKDNKENVSQAVKPATSESIRKLTGERGQGERVGRRKLEVFPWTNPCAASRPGTAQPWMETGSWMGSSTWGGGEGGGASTRLSEI